MAKDQRFSGFSRRELLRFSAAGTLALAVQRSLPSNLFSPAGEKHEGDSSSQGTSSTRNLYSELVKTWCDGLLGYQVKEPHDPALAGGLLCPACGLIHGRCADAVYPLLHMAHTTGQSRYLEGAQLIYDWTERQVSRPDGSWVNDVSVQDWQGITVFRAVAIAEALRHYGSLLDARTSQRWTDRLARAALSRLMLETSTTRFQPPTLSPCVVRCSVIPAISIAGGTSCTRVSSTPPVQTI